MFFDPVHVGSGLSLLLCSSVLMNIILLAIVMIRKQCPQHWCGKTHIHTHSIQDLEFHLLPYDMITTCVFTENLGPRLGSVCWPSLHVATAAHHCMGPWTWCLPSENPLDFPGSSYSWMLCQRKQGSRFQKSVNRTGSRSFSGLESLRTLKLVSPPCCL